MTTRLFGERVERREDARLLAGRGRFTDDFEHGAAEVAFVRSDHAHARLVDVDVSGALDVDGVLGVYTHEDLEGGFGEPLPLLTPHEGIVAPRTQHALARNEVRYAGEIVAMVVAVDRYVAEDAAERIRVAYEPLPVQADLATADEVAGRFSEEVGDVDAALADALHVFTWRFAIERSASMPMEARAVVARWDIHEERLLVHDSTQAPTGIRGGLASLFRLDLEQVHVVAPDVGGGFGVKVMQFYPEEVLIPWAARRLGRPVKWTEDRREHFVGSNHERGQIHDVRVGVDDDGRILALETKFVHDAGAYCPYGIMVPVITAAQLPGPYKLPNYRYAFRALFTNTLPVSPYRGAGRPQAAFVIERTLDRIAGELGLDRAEVRRRNLIGPGEFPYNVGVTFQDGGLTVYDSGDYPRGLELLLDAVDYRGFEDERERAAAEGRRLGLGLAGYVEGTGIGPYEGAAVNVLANGTVTVATGLGTQGQAHETVFAQVVADELGVPLESVAVTTGDTRRIGYGVGTFASRSAVVSGNAVQMAAVSVRRQAQELAARLLEADADDVELVDGEARVRGAPGSAIRLGQLAVVANPLRYAFGHDATEAAMFARKAYASGEAPLREGASPGLNAVEYFSPRAGVFGFGMHAAVVEIDPDTCNLLIRRYVMVHDCGRVINPMVVEGQMLGGFAQGIGGAFFERLAYDENGQLQNASFMDFLIPYATEVPVPELIHMETPSPSNALGVKGVGEAGTIAVPAAIANAVSHALGRPVDRMPLSPLQLFEILHPEGTP
ncbi:MAG TPA: aerobic carbon-monoxide dehydrogenase large subunit [Solirubrobacteraceae bacterium]|nr:aerobic carbon-monoxide dehydrogenase large subunit [Solirubrobacteraceae bacterium]